MKKKTKAVKEKKVKKAKKPMTKGKKIANIIIKTLSILLFVASCVVVFLFLKGIFDLDMLPMKYFKIGALSLIGFELLYALICINKRRVGILIILFDILAIILMGAQLFALKYINTTQDFLKDNLMKDYEVDEYYFVTNAASSIDKLEDYDGTVYYSVDIDYYDKLKKAYNKKTSCKIEKVETLSDSLMKLDTLENVILINSGTFDSITENDPEYDKNTKIIDSVKIYLKNDKKSSKSSKDITSEPFIIYLSGIDTRGTTLVKKSLSDVNMFIVVNPNTKTILLVSIPRDSYVQLHGYTGRKDKLTHAGSLGGVELSKATCEDLMGYTADYYMRVNFRAVINLVDAVGGVTVVEENTNSPFRLWTNRTCLINKGENHLNGECALAFARERYHYSKGDMQRNLNQQMVLKALFDKISTSTYAVANYNKLLAAVDGTFETSMTQEDIAALVKFQLKDMSAWKFESQNVTGGTGREQTYSGGSTPLSVVYPSSDSINAAKEAIRKVLAGEDLHAAETVTE